LSRARWLVQVARLSEAKKIRLRQEESRAEAVTDPVRREKSWKKASLNCVKGEGELGQNRRWQGRACKAEMKFRFLVNRVKAHLV
jgi:hypothetical protein